MAKLNPTAPLRQGFHYQALWALQLCGEFMLHPDGYQWIQCEAAPDEFSGGGVSLDDIVVCDAEGRYHLYQVKHRQDPQGNPWSWRQLLDQRISSVSRRRQSLIQKWAGSLRDPGLEDRIAYAALITDGYADDDLRASLRGDLVDPSAFREHSPQDYGRAEDQLGGERNLHSFLSQFHFRFRQETPDALESRVRATFSTELRSTEPGFDRLFHTIKAECRRRRTRPITLSDLRKWCYFDDPRPLDEAFHAALLSELSDPRGGIKVLVGKPGVGKSTYASSRLLKNPCCGWVGLSS